MNVEDVGRRIRAARESRQMTQTELGEKVGYSAVQIGRLERGERRVTIGKLQELADALGVTVEHLMGRSAQDSHGVDVDDAKRWILEADDMPAGLVALANSSNMAEVLGITPLEWRILLSLVEAWPDAPLVTRDGWVSILFSLRAAGRTDKSVTKM